MTLKRILIFCVIVGAVISCKSEDAVIEVPTIYPAYGAEKDVVINGLSFDAMEPFLSSDGKYLFFNNLNDGINTRLYYATRLNDSTFNFVGELNGTNQDTTPHLDAVADMDENGNFYWTSTRNYPDNLNNLFRGNFSAGEVTDISRVNGDFNKNIPGWLVMDHGINKNGQYLYFNNARFDDANCTGVCETTIGVAEKVSDTEFSTLSNSTTILQNINDDNFIYYAPCISSDDLELYYTRYRKGEITVNTTFEICVSIRETATSVFSQPKVLFSESIGDLIEAVTISDDKSIIYYHRKTADSHKIVMRNRIN